MQDRFAAWANGTGSPFELLDENATWTITGRSAASKTYANREAFMTEVIRPFNARMQAPPANPRSAISTPMGTPW